MNSLPSYAFDSDELSHWMEDNGIESIVDFASVCGVPESTMRRVMKENAVSSRTIRRILSATGLEFDDVTYII